MIIVFGDAMIEMYGSDQDVGGGVGQVREQRQGVLLFNALHLLQLPNSCLLGCPDSTFEICTSYIIAWTARNECDWKIRGDNAFRTTHILDRIMSDSWA